MNQPWFLPPGKTCGHCVHFDKCNDMVGQPSNFTTCIWPEVDFKPLSWFAHKIAVVRRAVAAADRWAYWKFFDRNKYL